MEDRKDAHTNRHTLDESAKPRTTPDTEAQNEQKKAERRTGDFPPKTAPKDDDVEQSVERESWDRLKAKPINRREKPDQD
ncbi:hypothetical protein D1224_12045 [Henriciella barbarensis]|uniref:Uncharacterized protein n=1 Tax=Henriciella barbarensis TaxID=86342 RepID=A0A399QY98_9PROT|nr:hypothetical protein [Henriciella barbarensis]RIJ22279.1 hypothetical protein D1224_12045 [Henriciella barbarensis]